VHRNRNIISIKSSLCKLHVILLIAGTPHHATLYMMGN